MMDHIFKQRRAINLFFIVIFLLGFLSLNQLGTAELPEPPNSGLRVTAILPGASPDEIDKKVARLLQYAIKDISGVEEVSSQSHESQVSLSVKFIDGHHDEAALVREVTQSINQVIGLPKELEGPFIFRPSNRIFPAMTLLLEGNDDLKRHNAWYKIQQIIKNINAVEYLETLGDRERRIEIQFDSMKLQQLNVRVEQVSHIIQQTMTDQSAGRIETFLSLNRIRVKALPESLEQLSNLPIKIGLDTFPLNQLAEIHEVLAPERLRVMHDGNKAWYINIYRRQGSKISDLSEAVKQVVEKTNLEFKEHQQGMQLIIIQDRNFIVERVLGELTESIYIGMLLVVLVLWCFFGFHNAIYSAIGIPFSFMVTFLVMDYLGIGLNTFTLFGLVMVCGMIVDDSIVILENICSKTESGLGNIEAIKKGLIEVAPAVVTSTGTTIAAFLPLLLMTGGMGDFISQIPKVAIIALVASLLECFIILPVHIFQRRKKNKPFVSKNALSDNIFNRTMNNLGTKLSIWVDNILHIPYKVLMGFLMLLAMTVALTYYTLDFQMFDSDEVRSIRVHLTFPKTTDLQMTSRLLDIKRLELENVPLVKDIVIMNGWSDYNYNQMNRSHLATIEVLLEKPAFNPDNAQIVSEQLSTILNRLPGLEKLHLVLAKNKPPVETPVKIYLYGNDSKTLSEAYSRVSEKLNSIKSIKNISNPLEDGLSELVFNVNEEMAAYYGIQAKEIGNMLYRAVTGEKIAKLDRGDEIVDIYVLTKKSSHWQNNKINHLTLDNGQIIPISQLGEFISKPTPNIIRRYQGNRFIRITADIDTEMLSNFKTHREIERLITDDLLPKGVSFEQLGEFSVSQKSLTSMYQSGLLAIGLCYMILATLFRSYTQPLVVLLTIPLAYMGVVWGMSIMGKDLSLMGLMGIIGLIGIVLNDSLVWVNCYNQLKAKNEFKELAHTVAESNRLAAVKAVKLRFRPIMLTTITTIFGMLPIVLSSNSGLVGSMANTIVSGLLTASILLLIFLPVCMVVIDDISLKMSKVEKSSIRNKFVLMLPFGLQQKLQRIGFTS